MTTERADGLTAAFERSIDDAHTGDNGDNADGYDPEAVRALIRDVERSEAIGPERFKRWSITDLMKADLTYRWLAEGFMVDPTYGIDSGELKTLKSYFGLARAVGLAAGVPILGRWYVPDRRRVLIYVAEGGRIPFTRRLIRVCEAHGVDVHDLDGWLEPVFDAVTNAEACTESLLEFLWNPLFQHRLVG